MHNACVKSSSVKNTIIFHHKFQHAIVPNIKLFILIKKLRHTGSLLVRRMKENRTKNAECSLKRNRTEQW
jgi:hypothetical protein